jgi:hypothetical protein
MNPRTTFVASFAFCALGLAAYSAPVSAQQVVTALDGSPGVTAEFVGPPTSAAGAELVACEANDAASCYALGNRYHGGDGVPRDNEYSVHLIGRACELGSNEACYDLGVRHLLGEYAEQSAALAVHNFELACEGGYAVSCYFLGTLVRDGVGLSQGATLATQLFERACARGYTDACGQSGAFVAGDVERALPQGVAAEIVGEARACDRGAMAGCHSLAGRYGRGELGEDGERHEYVLLERACDWGYLVSCTQLRENGDR